MSYENLFLAVLQGDPVILLKRKLAAHTVNWREKEEKVNHSARSRFKPVSVFQIKGTYKKLGMGRQQVIA